MTVLERLKEYFDSVGVSYRLVSHEPTHTSEESARARGEDLSTGGKAILLKADETFSIFVISASLKIDSKRIREYLGAKRTRFATREELFELTGLVPGSLPPFGRPLFEFDLFADESIAKLEKIAFNAGSLTDSIIMSARDYRALAKPAVFPFAETVEGVQAANSGA